MPETLTLHIEKLVPGGEGLARHQGRVVFIAGVLPGETVAAEIFENRKDFLRGRLLRVVRAAPDRIAPPCPLSGICGGCDWLHIDPAAQAAFKIEMVRDALRRVGGLEIPDLQIESGPALGYRNRLQLHTDGSGAVGFLERGGKSFVPVQHCPVAHPAFTSLFQNGAAPNAPARFLAFAVDATDGSPRCWREDETPEANIAISLAGRDLVFPVRGFFQSNLALLPRLLEYALADLRGDTVFDLYAGSGLFGAFLRPAFRRIVCAESDPEALRCARRNIGTDEAIFLSGRLEVLVENSGGILRRERADAAILDPPREGLAPAVRDYLRAQRIPRIIYVSCDPVTLARDLKALRAGPYVLTDLRLFDFFPQTSHVEAVAKLEIKL